jgi:predicted nicotinamide N-methyase
MAELNIERIPEYWAGRRATRQALADHGDQGNHDALTCRDYDAIIAGLGAGAALTEIPEYRAVSERVTNYNWSPRPKTFGFD